MLTYDEERLVTELEVLPRGLCGCFAAACAERLFPRIAAFSTSADVPHAERARRLLDRLWEDLAGNPMEELELAAALDETMAMIPSEETYPELDEQPGAEDACAALAYALRARRTGASQEAAWAGRRAFEATDFDAQGDANDVQVQRELANQRDDLELLRQLGGRSGWSDGVAQLRSRSARGAHSLLQRAGHPS